MGKCFAPNAFRISLGLEGIKRPLIRMLRCLTNIAGITSKYKSEISRFAICNEGCPTQWRVSCAKASGKIRLSAKTRLILMKNTDSKKGKILIAIRHLKQAVPHLNPI